MNRMTEDRRRMTENVWVSRLSSVVCPLSSVLCLLLVLAGCKNRELDQARQEAREAKVTISKLNYNLKTAAENLATKDAELRAVQQNRDELQKQVQQLLQEREQTSTSVRNAQEAIARLTTQAKGQDSTTTALQKQVAELKTLVEEQLKLIEQLKKEAAAGPAQAGEKQTAPDPNEGP